MLTTYYLFSSALILSESFSIISSTGNPPRIAIISRVATFDIIIYWTGSISFLYVGDNVGINSFMYGYLSTISPIKWVNDSLFYLMFGGQTNPIPTTLVVNLGLGTIFILFALVRMRKQVTA